VCVFGLLVSTTAALIMVKKPKCKNG
jgi:hypothetical protein